MKYFFTFLTILISLCTGAQNVGIGTTVPAEKLEIKNPGRSTLKISNTGFYDTSQIILSNRNGNGLGTEFLITSKQEQGLFFTSRSDISPNVNDSSLVIRPNGNIGIGVTTPANKLEVFGNSLLNGSLTVGLITTPNNLMVYGNTGLGIIPTARLHVNGNELITYDNVLEFGNGFTKETNSGKIGYQTFTSDALDIIGAGTTAANRKIHFWNEGNAAFNGPIIVYGSSIFNANLQVNGKVTTGSTGTINMLPVAYANISHDGHVLNGSGNVTSTVVTTNNIYDIAVSGLTMTTANTTFLLTLTNDGLGSPFYYGFFTGGKIRVVVTNAPPGYYRDFSILVYSN